MSSPTILLLESIHANARDLLDQHTVVFEGFEPAKALEIAHDQPVSGIITRGKGQVSANLIKACSQLKVIARCGVGLDNVDIPAANQQQVKVINLPGSNAHTVAEHTLALMLSLQRQLYQSISAVKRGDWAFRNDYQGDEIRGKRVGILGMGNIGSKVAKLVQAFGAEVIYWSTKPDSQHPFTYASLGQILSACHIVSIHLPLVPETHELLNEKTLSLMKPGSLIINTSRGAIIHERSLLSALNSGKLGGYASDVLTQEPPLADHPLLSLPQVLITPHSASLTATTYEQMCLHSVGNTLSILGGKTINEKFIFNRDRL